jgi:hypothetical protein
MQFTPKNRIRLLAVALFVLLALPLTKCYAQFNSSVEGTVTDQTGAVVGNAQVTLHDLQTNVDRTAVTQATGYYRFNGIGPGDYRVIVEATGFAKKIVNAHVTQDQTAGVNVALTLTSASTTLTVTAVADQLNPDETRLQTTLEAEQIENLPLQNGSVLETVRIAPGVTGIDEDNSLSIIALGGSTMNAQADGRPNSSSTYQLDGVSIQNNTGFAGSGNVTSNRVITFEPIQDAVQEVAIEVNTYSADSTGTSSFKVNMTTKGGTNKFHGALGYRYSSNNLNAVSYGSNPETPNSRRWLSGSVGGPIVKDKTFFFFSYLRQKQAIPRANSANFVMDNAFAGTWAPANFPDSVTVKNLLVPFPIGNATGGQSAFNTLLGPTKTAEDVADWVITPDVSCAVPKVSAADPGGTIAADGIPLPCTTVISDYDSFSQAPRENGYQLDGRIDQYFRGGQDRIYGAYVLEPQTSDFLWWRPGFNGETPGGTRYVNLNYTHLFSPNLISQTSISAVRFYNSFTGNLSNTIPFFSYACGSACQGIDSGLDFFGSAGGSANSKSHNYQLHEDVTWTHGRHNVKGGFLLAHMDNYNNNAGYNSRGASADFQDNNTDPLNNCYCSGYAPFFNDQLQSYSFNSTISGITGGYRGDVYGSQVLQYGLYVQDDWKVKSNLLVTLGLRWDNYGNPSNYGSGSLPWVNMISPAGTSLQQNITSDNISTGAVSNAFSSSQDLNILPRVGFAWTPFPTRKLTVHGGIGLYEDAMNLGVSGSALSSNSPSQLNLSFNAWSSTFPTNDVDVLNLFGTNTNIAPPYGRTYTHPVIPVLGVDSHGELCATLACSGSGGIVVSQLTGVDPHLKPQKTAQYNLQVEQEFTHNLIAGVGYSGSFSWNQYTQEDYNTFPGDIIQNGSEKRLSSEWGGIYETRGILSGNYNALMLTARQTYHRLSWQAAYTWAKTLAYGGYTATGGGGAANASVNIYDPEHFYGPVFNSVPHSFNGSVAYELPGRSLHNFAVRAVLAGWEISAIATAQSGSPFSISTGAGFSGSGTLNPSAGGDYLANGNGGGGVSLVNVAAGVKRKGYTRDDFKAGIFSSYGFTPTNTPVFNAASSPFTNPVGYGTNPVYSNQGLNSFYGPGYLGVDSALHKKVLLPWVGKDSGSTLTMGIEGSNILNRANLAMPNSTSMSNLSGFGVSTGANQARVLQVIGKFQF